MKKNKPFQITQFLTILYVILLTWIILFKMQFSLSDLPHFRNLNLIPFGESVIINGKIDFDEIIDNVIAFIPLGMYCCMLKKDWNFWKKVLPIFALSFTYEILQYLFAIGATDITDILTNTSGGIIGIGIYQVFLKVFKKEEKVNKIINVLAIIGTTLLLALILLMLMMN